MRSRLAPASWKRSWIRRGLQAVQSAFTQTVTPWSALTWKFISHVSAGCSLDTGPDICFAAELRQGGCQIAMQADVSQTVGTQACAWISDGSHAIRLQPQIGHDEWARQSAKLQCGQHLLPELADPAGSCPRQHAINGEGMPGSSRNGTLSCMMFSTSPCAWDEKRW